MIWYGSLAKLFCIVSSWYKKYYWQQWCGNFVGGGQRVGLQQDWWALVYVVASSLLMSHERYITWWNSVSKEIVQFVRMYICELHKWSCRPMFDWKLDHFVCGGVFWSFFYLICTLSSFLWYNGGLNTWVEEWSWALCSRLTFLVVHFHWPGEGLNLWQHHYIQIF